VTLRAWLRGNKLFFADLILIALGVLFTFILRLNLEQLLLDYLPAFFWMLLAALLIKPVVYRQFGLYQRVWAYASIAEMRLIIMAVSVASLITAIVIYLLYALNVFSPMALSLPVFDWLISLGAVGGVRFALRTLAENRTILEKEAGLKARKALIIGAGDAGALVVREVQKNPQLSIIPVGLLDDDEEKQGQSIHGVPVVGKLNDLRTQARRLDADEAIMAIPSAPGSVLRQVAEECRAADIPFRTMPGIYELIGGKVSVNRLREVDITDLLRREPTQIDRQSVGGHLKGKRVLITGAGGSIASELCRQVARWSPSQLILLGHGENSIFEIFVELHSDFPNLEMKPLIADVRDKNRVAPIFTQFKPDIIFHTAAHKHVPLMEANVAEAVTNNVTGTKNVVEAAQAAGVPQLIMVSTDKAVRPASVYGATKRIAEWIVMDAKDHGVLSYSVVRFGNVLGSRGSVVPLFKRQIAQGGPVTVTHPEMERYFMTIPEAVHLVLQASTFAQQGQLYMLEMGKPVKIVDLANDLIRLSGLQPNEDIQIEFSGLRPGEKLSEQLWEQGAEYKDTSHPDIRQVIEPEQLKGEKLTSTINQLTKLAQLSKEPEILEFLQGTFPGSEIGSTPPPEITSIA
jgi:FlaA1/EpsC-like NDP-sugar epimerase